jgi:putative ABC transport system substrate-binding protein
LTLVPLAVSLPSDFGPAFVQAISKRADSATIHAGALSGCCVPQIVDFSLQHRLPTMFGTRQRGPDLGGLMSYGLTSTDNYRHAAVLVDKILKGTKPGDIPIENPTGFEFVINLATAQAIGLTVPPEVLRQATDIIQ